MMGLAGGDDGDGDGNGDGSISKIAEYVNDKVVSARPFSIIMISFISASESQLPWLRDTTYFEIERFFSGAKLHETIFVNKLLPFGKIIRRKRRRQNSEKRRNKTKSSNREST